MEITRIPFQHVREFSQKDVAYATKDPALRPFYKYEATLEAFGQVIEDKSKEQTDRQTLVEVLRQQYDGLPYPSAVQKNVEQLLLPNTFTITTAHQPSLCTGPLYYLHKIASTIHLSRILTKNYPDYNFIPVFVTGGEDHDFDEINHFRLFNRTITWQNEESGSVGMMSTESVTPVLNELKEVLGSSPLAEEILEIITAAYTQNALYGRASIHLTSALFGEYGLVVLGMNDPRLKKRFASIIRQEIIDQPSKALVDDTAQKLTDAGFSGQAHARDINLFYLMPQTRERIVQENGIFKVLNRDLSFSKEEMLQEIENHPERFSPNVIMRPLYQELILPNLAYIGGGGEIAYWLERKSQFQHFKLNFPMLIRRNSAVWIDKGIDKRILKLGLTIHDLFTETEHLIKQYVNQNSNSEITLSEEKKSLDDLFSSVLQKASDIDPTLAKKVAGEHARQSKSLEQIETRLMRAEKQKHETSINQIRSTKEKLFPNNGLQERHDNFLPFYIKYGRRFFDILIDHLNPLEEGMVVIREKG